MNKQNPPMEVVDDMTLKDKTDLDKIKRAVSESLVDSLGVASANSVAAENTTKDHIKEAVSESLIEALNVANMKKLADADGVKESIKEAVSESLLEALKIANVKKDKEENALNSGLNWVLNLLNKLMPMALLALLGWVALTVMDNQTDLLKMRIQINAMDNSMMTFIDKDSRKAGASALLHHSTSVNPCNSCHTRDGIVVHTLASLPSTSLMPGDLFEQKCGSCHTLDRILTKTGSHESWKKVVNEMQAKRANWISAKQAEIILGYLDQLEKHK